MGKGLRIDIFLKVILKFNILMDFKDGTKEKGEGKVFGVSALIKRSRPY